MLNFTPRKTKETFICWIPRPNNGGPSSLKVPRHLKKSTMFFLQIKTLWKTRTGFEDVKELTKILLTMAMESVSDAGCDAFSLLRLSWPKLSGDDITGGRKVCVTLFLFFGPLSFWQCNSWNIPSLLGSNNSEHWIVFCFNATDCNMVWARNESYLSHSRLFKTRGSWLSTPA